MTIHLILAVASAVATGGLTILGISELMRQPKVRAETADIAAIHRLQIEHYRDRLNRVGPSTSAVLVSTPLSPLEALERDVHRPLADVVAEAEKRAELEWQRDWNTWRDES